LQQPHICITVRVKKTKVHGIVGCIVAMQPDFKVGTVWHHFKTFLNKGSSGDQASAIRNTMEANTIIRPSSSVSCPPFLVSYSPFCDDGVLE
jgi:hypothetical protein